MMDGNQFLDLAIRLSAGDKEVDLRTSVSRAYYGAFHAARDLVQGCGVRFSKSDGGIHTHLKRCLDQSQNVHPFPFAKEGEFRPAFGKLLYRNGFVPSGLYVGEDRPHCFGGRAFTANQFANEKTRKHRGGMHSSGRLLVVRRRLG